MARPLTRAQALQNRSFLNLLRRTGNVRLACREAGLGYGTMQKRRRTHPAFASAWDAALAFAQARLRAAGRQRPRAGRGAPSPHRTQGGEPVIVRRRDGTLQLRRAPPGRLTREGEQAFLAAVGATANVRLAAAAVGAAHTSFYWRKRTDRAFARELRLALKQGYEALELALLETQAPASHEHDDWRHNDPPPIPPMSVNQALQLMYLHQKAALLADEPTPLRRRRGESNAARCERLAQMAEARDQRAREAFEVAEAERIERGLPAWGPAGEAVRAKLRQAQDRRLAGEGEGPSTASGGPPALEIEGRIWLPDLAQVTGWSNADPAKVPHDRDAQPCRGHGEHRDDRALFGGWRIEDMTRAQSVRGTDEHEAQELEWREGESFEAREEPKRKGPRVRRL